MWTRSATPASRAVASTRDALRALSQHDEVALGVPHPAQGGHDVVGPLPAIQPTDDAEEGRRGVEAQVGANRGDGGIRHAGPRVQLRVHADARHEQQAASGHDPMPQGGGVVPFVDDHEAIGPATGDLLRGEEGEVRQQPAVRVEVESVRRVDGGRPPLDGKAADRGPRHECRDRRVDVHDVVAGAHDPGDRPQAAHDPADVQDGARQRDLVERVEVPLHHGVDRRPAGRGLDAPALLAEVRGVGEHEHEGVGDRGHHQDGRLGRPDAGRLGPPWRDGSVARGAPAPGPPRRSSPALRGHGATGAGIDGARPACRAPRPFAGLRSNTVLPSPSLVRRRVIGCDPSHPGTGVAAGDLRGRSYRSAVPRGERRGS